MKKYIYILGMVCLSIILVAVIFKISHWPGAGILLTIGIGSLPLLFLPLTYSQAIKSTDDKLLKFLFLAGFVSFSIDFIGMLFKVMHWPGAGIFLMIGIPLPFIFFLPVYIYYHIKRKLKTDLNFFAVLIFMIYVGVFSTLLALRPGTEILTSYGNSTNQMVDANNYLIANTLQSKSSEISGSTQQLVKQLEEIKHQLIVATEQDKAVKKNPDGNIDYTTIPMKDMKISIEKLNECGFKKFNDDFETFSKNLIEKSQNPNINQLIDEINKYRLPENNEEVSVIVQFPIISIMNVLTDWQNKLLLINYMQGIRST